MSTMPALLTSPSNRPQRSTVAATSRAGVSGSATSPGTVRPRSPNSAAVSAAVTGLRSLTATRTPASAQATDRPADA
jgi:hypothetical protein